MILIVCDNFHISCFTALILYTDLSIKMFWVDKHVRRHLQQRIHFWEVNSIIIWTVLNDRYVFFVLSGSRFVVLLLI